MGWVPKGLVLTSQEVRTNNKNKKCIYFFITNGADDVIVTKNALFSQGSGFAREAFRIS